MIKRSRSVASFVKASFSITKEATKEGLFIIDGGGGRLYNFLGSLRFKPKTLDNHNNGFYSASELN